MRLRAFWALPVAAMLASCGGSSSGGSGSVSVPSPTPTPVPTASPTPTPTPTPTPATVYVRAFDLAQDRALALYGAELASGPRGEPPYSGQLLTRSGLTFTAATGAATLTLEASRQESFAAPTSRNADVILYERASPYGLLGLYRTPIEPGNPNAGFFDYGLLSTYLETPGTQSVTRFFVTGDPTRAAEIPQTGVRAYRINFAASRPNLNSFFKSVTQVSVDFAARTITGSFATDTPTSQNGGPTVTVTGRFDAAGGITGTVSSNDGYSGPLVGRIFGPDAAEFGFGFSIARGDERGAGTLLARCLPGTCRTS